MQIYLLRITYLKQRENGSIYKASGHYAVEAVSFTDAEATLLMHLEESIPEYNLKAVALSNITDVSHDEDADYFFKVKIAYSSFDEDSGRKKEITQYFLVQANSVKEAGQIIEDKMKDSVVAVEVQTVTKTKVEEVVSAK